MVKEWLDALSGWLMSKPPAPDVTAVEQPKKKPIIVMLEHDRSTTYQEPPTALDLEKEAFRTVYLKSMAHIVDVESAKFAALAGINYANPDGTKRQEILRECKNTEWLHLVHNPANEFDKNAIEVRRPNWQQIGHLHSSAAAQVASDLRKGRAWFGVFFRFTPGRGKQILSVGLMIMRLDVEHSAAELEEQARLAGGAR